MFEVQEYLDERHRSPFADWLKPLPLPTRARIAARIARLRSGNFGDSKSVGKGVQEARVHFGPGFRIYFGFVDQKLILLLAGGSKKSQTSDIKNAQNYLKDWKENKG